MRERFVTKSGDLLEVGPPCISFAENQHNDTTMTHEQLTEVLRLHKMWLNGEDGGKRANLRGAYMRGAYLRGADLSGADLSGANLSSADLSGADLSGAYMSCAYLSGADLSGANLRGAYLRGAVHAWSQVAFMGHGEIGRMLTAVIFKEGDTTVYQCGCFWGSAEELRQYIEQGEDQYKPSRMRAFEIATELLSFPKQ